MTISTTSSQAILLGNGATATFTYNFVCDSDATFQAIYTDATGLATPLTASQYTLFRNPVAANSLHSIGGTITYPTSGPPISSGTSLTVRRVLPLAQLDSISNQGDFYPTVTELALDSNVMQIQQVNARTGQLTGIWVTATLYSYADVVQDGANGANTLNYYLCVNENTSGVWATDLAAGYWSLVIDTQLIASYATAAAASAAAAAGSAATATTQAGIATTQAGIATAQVALAAAQVGLATTQAGLAATSAAAALVSQNAAAASAVTSTTQAGISTTQATASAASAVTSAASAAAAAASAILAGSALSSTSTTSLLIATGSKTFTTQASKNYFPGQFLIAASNANETNYMHGQVTSYSGTTLIVNVTDIGGAGTFADWNISVSGTGPVVGNIDGGNP